MDHITKQIETLQPTAIDKVKLRESKKEGDSYQCKHYVHTIRIYTYAYIHICIYTSHSHTNTTHALCPSCVNCVVIL